MARWALLAVLGGCFSGTTTTGLTRCVHVFFVIGYYSECEEGPPWIHDGKHAADPSEPSDPKKPEARPAGEACFRRVQPTGAEVLDCSPSMTACSVRRDRAGQHAATECVGTE